MGICFFSKDTIGFLAFKEDEQVRFVIKSLLIMYPGNTDKELLLAETWYNICMYCHIFEAQSFL